MRFSLLGSLSVTTDDGIEVPVFASRQRTLLAALLLHANQPVTYDSLAEALWEHAPPLRYTATLRSYVLRLRHTLGRDVAARLVTRNPGYLFQVDEDELDVLRFEASCRHARQALRAGAWAEASAAATRALAMWRAAPLLDVASARLRAAWVPPLEELRLQAFEAHAEAEIQLGHHEPLLPELREHTTHHPLREELQAAFVRALSGAGQRAEALAAYQRARRVLVDELGLEPGPKLRAAQQDVLEADRRPVPDPGGPAPAARPWPVVRQLPPAVPQFVGRARELAALSAIVEPARSGNLVPIAAICGTAGVGKTALAVHWAYQVLEHFPDGQLYVNLHGFAPDRDPVKPAEAIRGFLDSLGVGAARIPADLNAQSALYRSLIAPRRILVILDNARDADQVRPLLPGGPTTAVVVTSRYQLISLSALEGAEILPVGLMTEPEARELLAARVGAARVAAEPQAVQRIVTASARLPIALAIVAARAAANPGFALTDVARELSTTRDRLDAFDGGDAAADVRAVFSWSYAVLSPPAARLFRLLGLHPGPDLDPPAAASLAAATPERVHPLLTELVRANLVTEHRPGRYSLHDLLRAYATQLADTTDAPRERTAAIGRVLDHYLHTAVAADRQLDPARDPISLPDIPPDVRPGQLPDHHHALDWFATQRPVLLAVIDRAVAAGRDDRAWQLAWALWTFLDRQGHWHDHAAAGRIAVGAATRTGDPTARGIAHRQLARAYLRLGRFDDALEQFNHALDRYVAAADLIGQANTHNNIAVLWERRDEPTKGLHHATEALDLFRRAGHRIGQAKALNNSGWFHALLGDYPTALAVCHDALALHRELANRSGQAGTLDSLGYINHQIGNHPEALACYREALHLHRELGDRYYEADSLARVADTYAANGDPAAARLAYQRALTILSDLDHPDADTVRAKLGELPHRQPGCVDRLSQ